MMMIVAINIQAAIKTMTMIETLLQAASKMRKPRVLLSKINLLKGHKLNEKNTKKRVIQREI